LGFGRAPALNAPLPSGSFINTQNGCCAPPSRQSQHRCFSLEVMKRKPSTNPSFGLVQQCNYRWHCEIQISNPSISNPYLVSSVCLLPINQRSVKTNKQRELISLLLRYFQKRTNSSFAKNCFLIGSLWLAGIVERRRWLVQFAGTKEIHLVNGSCDSQAICVHLFFLALGPYTETIDLWFELFFVKEIRRVIEWLREIKTANQHCYKFLLIQQNKFLRLN
jgi:hypothetical protein